MYQLTRLDPPRPAAVIVIAVDCLAHFKQCDITSLASHSKNVVMHVLPQT